MRAEILIRIYRDHKTLDRAKGVRQALCYLIAKLIDRKDVDGLKALGIGEREAIMAISLAKGEK